ncbi:glycosyltransferase [Fusobacterium polymorphum]|jgi:hypothetical protein|uniref:glycosyltransferase n=1 Tax=Fusobacterium nucleatum subsp. polymorphum TaxID=76857 RepID=UPI002B4BAE28|nr:glycosyltransferase [Fusobacterium polymorphum]WRL69995.1 glycosyltransferase [Fusobacterium polymorphum]
MKLLYLCFVEIVEISGISKKMLYQVKAFQNAGFDVKLCYEKIEKDKIYRKIYDTSITLEEVKNRKISRQFLHYKYDKLIEYILEEKIKVIYIRYNHIANPSFINFLKTLKGKNIKIILEVPTYPYDLEYTNVNFLAKLKHSIEKIYRQKMKKYIDRIVTFTNDEEIFGIKTISINNGISLEDISIIKKDKKEDKNKINFIGVAGISFWHGFDRMLLAMVKYYKKTPKREVIFHIVGDGDKVVIDSLKKIVKDNNLEKYVIFYGYKFGKELDEIYNKADIAVGSLGAFRKNIQVGSALKVREYCAKGLPFILSEEDTCIKEVFMYKIINDETIFDIEEIIEWYNNLKVSAEEIREYTKNNLTWDIQMKKVVDYILELN